MSVSAPLAGLKVLDFSQFLAGPYATLRLADLGADVIKIERTGKGDLSRHLYVSNVLIDGESTVFHAINRGKRSMAVDLKDGCDRDRVWDLIIEADVVIQNFRPGVIDRLGFGYEDVRAQNPNVVYGSISGYGEGHEWETLPGQDLLAQARSGVMWLTGARDHGPVPVGIPVADVLAGAALAQGLLALLVRRGLTGEGGHVETSLLEAVTDLQFELFSTFLNDGNKIPSRPRFNAAHAYLAAPYGVYEVRDGHVTVAMNDLATLFDCLDIDADVGTLDTFHQRDEISVLIGAALANQTRDESVNRMEQAGIWCAPVMNWHDLLGSAILQKLDMLGLARRGAADIQTVRSPLRIDGARPTADGPAPYLSNDAINWK